jgi:hypothetical protein
MLRNVLYIILSILGLYVVFAILKKGKYYLYDKRLKEPYLICNPKDATKIKIIPASKLLLSDAGTGLGFSYSCWIYIKDWALIKDKKLRYIFNSNNNIKLAIGSINKKGKKSSYYNNLSVVIKTYSGDESYQIKDIPLQKWLHIVVSLDNRSLDTFINGKLYKSLMLKDVPVVSKNAVSICPNGGYKGLISNFQYFNYPISQKKVYDIFRVGPKCNDWINSFLALIPSFNADVDISFK